MREALQQYLKRYASFSNSEIETIYECMECIEIPKKGFLLEAGNLCEHRFFIVKGLVRVYAMDEKGVDQITGFAIEHWWVTQLDSFVLGVPSSTFIQALEPTTVLAIHKDNLEVLYQKVPQLERVFRLITERWLVALQRKSQVYMKFSSKDRYYSLIESFPDFAQRVPQYMLASYLGISPEYLSEIRKQAP